MDQFIYIMDALTDFFESGGMVLWLILGVAIILWTLIIERYWYMYFTYPAHAKRIRQQWSDRMDRHSWYAERIRETYVSDASTRLNKSLAIINTLIGLCPLLGLLGTVTGMIHVFDVMAVSGTGNAREMASGVSYATIPTMAGMVIALSALYSRVQLKQKAIHETRRLTDVLSE